MRARELKGFVAFVLVAVMATIGASVRAQTADAGPIESLQFAMVAHGAAARQFVLFGGIRDGRSLDDTWVWNPAGWEEQKPATRPEPRRSAAMTYDGERQEVVLFGGVDQHSHRSTETAWAVIRKYPPPPTPPQEGVEVQYRDTWVWDGKDWIQRNPARSPGQRYLHAMAYDAARRQVVLFGGFDDMQGKPLNDTWIWDGHNWTKMNPATVPSARYWQGMAYDAAREQVVMFGGKDAGGYNLDETWIWNGTDWTRVEPAGEVPAARNQAGMDYDARAERVLLISGDVENAARLGSPANDTWTWDGSEWARMAARDFDLIFDSRKMKADDTNPALIITESAQVAMWVPKHGLAEPMK